MPLFLDRLLVHRAHHSPPPEVLRQGVLKERLAGSILAIRPEPDNKQPKFFLWGNGNFFLESGTWCAAGSCPTTVPCTAINPGVKLRPSTHQQIGRDEVRDHH